MSQMDTRILQKIEKKMCKKSDSIVIIYKSKLENCLLVHLIYPDHQVLFLQIL
jgi:hypothetical protein